MMIMLTNFSIMLPKFTSHQRLLFSTSSLHFKTQQSANDFISSLCKQNLFQKALQAFQSLQLNNPTCQLHTSTYAHLFVACSKLRSLHQGRQIHRHLSQFLAHPDVILCNHILNMYGKCGSPVDARRLFDEMPEKNLVSWTSMICGYSQNYREVDAVELYLEMIRSGLVPDQFCLGSVVRCCTGLGDIKFGRQLHGQAMKLDYGSDRIVQNAVVTMYSKFGGIHDASVVFERIVEKDIISWGSMIAGFAQQGCELEALLLFKEMFQAGIHRPNEFHFGSALRACGGLLQLEYGEQIHGICVKFGLESDEFAGCSLTDMYARFGMLDCARVAFYQIHMPDLVSWNSIISAFAYEGFVGDAMLFFSEMRDLGLRPDDITIRCLLCACASSASLVQGKNIHSHVVKIGFGVSIAVCNTLLAMYSKCLDFATTLELFEEMKNNRDLVSWNTILTACLQHQQPEEVFRLSKLLRNSYEFDQITLNTILSACGELAYLEMGNQVHAHASKAGLEDDQMVKNGLVDMYAKCGSLDDARKLFELMSSDRDVFSWSSLIVGYAQFGCGEQSLELFSCMMDLGIRPNHVTFVGVLTACSRIGLVDEGCYYYNAMDTVYGISPTKEHCSCIVDLLARAGRLEEAERFMDQMPYEPDIIMWKTLLSACRVHNNVKIATKAAKGILKIDPSNSAAYVLLCNILASSGCWDDVASLRKSMRSNSVRKSPGKSWIKIRGEVRVFIVEDRSHSETDDIYLILDLLGFEITKAGYEPKSSSWHEQLQTSHTDRFTALN